MPLSAQLPGDIIVGGQLVMQSAVIKTPSITPANQISTLLTLSYQQISTIVAGSQLMHIVRGLTATLKNVRAFVATKATGADRTVNVDVQKSTGGGAFATILSATILFNDASTDLIVINGTIASASLVAGDILKVVATVAGAAGAQAAGLGVTLHLEEAIL